ncbi:MAG: hypothetical protein ACAI43_16780 [Phycisphaerae bacterium]
MSTPNNPYPPYSPQQPPYPPQGGPPYGAAPGYVRPPGDMPPRRPEPKSKVPAIVATLLVLLVLGGGGYVIYKKMAPKPRDVEAEGQKYREASQAFSNTVALNSPEAKGIKAGLDAYTAAIARKDYTGAADRIDTGRMIEEIEASGLAKGMRAGERRGFEQGMKKSLANTLSQPYNGLAVTSIEPKKIRMLPSGTEAVVYMKARHPLLGALKYRWWMINKGGQWRMYDLEDLDGGIRISTLMGGMLAGGLAGGPPAWVNQAPQIQQMIQAMGSGDIDKTEQIVAGLENVGFPTPIKALVMMCKGVTRAARNDHNGALAIYDKAEQLQPDLVAVHSLRADSYNELGKHKEAEASCRKYLDLLGEDCKTLVSLGKALEKQGKKTEALDAYTRACDDEPTDADAALAYANFAAADRMGDATTRLAKALAGQEDAAATATAMADAMTTAPPAEALVAAYKKTKPADRATAAKLEAKAAGLKRGGGGGGGPKQ